MNNFTLGTIKIKDEVGNTIPFAIITDTSCILDATTGKTLDVLTTEYESLYAAKKAESGVELVTDMPTSESTSSYPNDTLFVCLDTEVFQYTIDTTKGPGLVTGVPFYASSSAPFIVDWGDGTTSTVTYASDTNRVHTYSTNGEYTIKISTYNWESVYYTTLSGSNYSVSYSTTYPIALFKQTLVSLDTPLPILKDVHFVRYNSYSTSSYSTCCVGYYMFAECSNLRTICSDFFKNYKDYSYSTSTTGNVVSFTYCFSNCTSLTAIPDNLFDGLENVQNFSYCFYYCSNLTSIGNDVFKDCTSVTNINYCFYYCTKIASLPADLFSSITSSTFEYTFSQCTALTALPAGLFDSCVNTTAFYRTFAGCTALATIPSDLFRYNTAVTSFSYCFNGCNSLMSIPQDLFRYNTNLTNVSYCFYRSSYNTFTFTLYFGSTNISNISNFVYANSSYQSSRKIYALTGSTTYSSFYNSRTTLRITVNTY